MGDRTFIKLTQDFAAEIGAVKAGVSSPSSVVDQTGEANNLARFIADANDAICNEYLDWNFLWELVTDTLAAGDQEIAWDDEWRSVDERGILFNPQSNNGYFPIYQPYPEYNIAWRQRAATTVVRPSVWTRNPNPGTILISHKATNNIDYELPVWKWATRLAADDDVTPLPRSLGDRIVICRAMMIYAVREDAPEILAGASAEYDDLMQKLEANCLPGHKRRGQGEATFIPQPELR